jgi:hypothetical protein
LPIASLHSPDCTTCKPYLPFDEKPGTCGKTHFVILNGVKDLEVLKFIGFFAAISMTKGEKELERPSGKGGVRGHNRK